MMDPWDQRYVYQHLFDFFWVFHLGKYTIPMNPMGSSEANRFETHEKRGLFLSKHIWSVHFQNVVLFKKIEWKTLPPKTMSNKTPQQKYHVTWHLKRKNTHVATSSMLSFVACTHKKHRNDMFVHEIFPFFARFEAVLSSRRFSDMSSHPHSIKPPFLSRNKNNILKTTVFRWCYTSPGWNFPQIWQLKYNTKTRRHVSRPRFGIWAYRATWTGSASKTTSTVALLRFFCLSYSTTFPMKRDGTAGFGGGSYYVMYVFFWEILIKKMRRHVFLYTHLRDDSFLKLFSNGIFWEWIWYLFAAHGGVCSMLIRVDGSETQNKHLGCKRLCK